MTSVPVKKIDAAKIRKEIIDLSGRLHEIKEESDSKLFRLSTLVYTVQENNLFRQWDDPGTGKPFKSFDRWLQVDVKESRGSVYRFKGIRKYLGKIANNTLEKIGIMRCFELVKVARDKPKLLPSFLKEIEKKPDLPLYTLQQMVTNAMAGQHYDSGKYERVEFAVKVEDLLTVQKALAVLQAIESIPNPESASGRGFHLAGLCEDYLSGKEQGAILLKLEEAGAFDKAAFKIEN